MSGNIYEVYEYESPVLEGYEIPEKEKGGRDKVANLENKEKNREKVLQRARQKIRRQVNANVFQWTQPDGRMAIPKMVTLTFAENVQDVETANYEFKKYILRLKHKYRQDVAYTAVIEFQERGAVHYHVIFYNLPYIADLKQFEQIWKNGQINVKAIKKVDNLGAYLCKYLTKDTAESLKEKKSYFSSRGLKQPEEIKDAKKVSLIEQGLGQEPVFETEFDNEHTGKVTYKQYNLNAYVRQPRRKKRKNVTVKRDIKIS